jgi:hypothetical protein
LNFKTLGVIWTNTHVLVFHLHWCVIFQPGQQMVIHSRNVDLYGSKKIKLHLSMGNPSHGRNFDLDKKNEIHHS